MKNIKQTSTPGTNVPYLGEASIKKYLDTMTIYFRKSIRTPLQRSRDKDGDIEHNTTPITHQNDYRRDTKSKKHK